MTKMISVEVCHIYVNENFSHEHENSIQNFIDLKDKLLSHSDIINISTVVMIDDYNPTFDVLNRDELFSTISEHGVTVDFYIYESSLLLFVEQLLRDVSKEVRNEYTRYINNRGMVPCSFLIAIFYLLRLGYFPHKESFQIIHSLGNPDKSSFFADEIYNILDLKYTAVEDKASRILNSLTDKKIAITNKINDVFY